MASSPDTQETRRFWVTWYTQPIADFLVGNFEEAALQFYAIRAKKS